MDDFGAGWNIFIIATLECFAIVHVYGTFVCFAVILVVLLSTWWFASDTKQDVGLPTEHFKKVIGDW